MCIARAVAHYAAKFSASAVPSQMPPPRSSPRSSPRGGWTCCWPSCGARVPNRCKVCGMCGWEWASQGGPAAGGGSAPLPPAAPAVIVPPAAVPFTPPVPNTPTMPATPTETPGTPAKPLGVTILGTVDPSAAAGGQGGWAKLEEDPPLPRLGRHHHGSPGAAPPPVCRHPAHGVSAPGRDVVANAWRPAGLLLRERGRHRESGQASRGG